MKKVSDLLCLNIFKSIFWCPLAFIVCALRWPQPNINQNVGRRFHSSHIFLMCFPYVLAAGTTVYFKHVAVNMHTHLPTPTEIGNSVTAWESLLVCVQVWLVKKKERGVDKAAQRHTSRRCVHT